MSEYRPPSRSLSPFLTTAEELYAKLSADTGVQSERLAEQALRFMETFRAWSTSPPTDDQRVRSIQELLDFSRVAYEWLSRVT